MLYLALLGKDWRKGFSPITNPTKLANGALYDWQMRHALGIIHRTSHFGLDTAPLLQPFDGCVTLEMVVAVHTLLPNCPIPLNPKDFAAGYPFDAYVDTGATR